MWKTIIPQQWMRRIAATSIMILASTLFLLNLRRQGARAERAAERLTTRERTNHAQYDMLDAEAERSRSRDDLLDRLRRGGL